jgi:hypothetical protein
MQLRTVAFVVTLTVSFVVHGTSAPSSPLAPYGNYDNFIAVKENVSDLWWTVNTTGKEITFELHVKTTGWIALGISPGRSSRSPHRSF